MSHIHFKGGLHLVVLGQFDLTSCIELSVLLLPVSQSTLHTLFLPLSHKKVHGVLLSPYLADKTLCVACAHAGL